MAKVIVSSRSALVAPCSMPRPIPRRAGLRPSPGTKISPATAALMSSSPSSTTTSAARRAGSPGLLMPDEGGDASGAAVLRCKGALGVDLAIFRGVLALRIVKPPCGFTVPSQPLFPEFPMRLFLIVSGAGTPFG